VLALKRGLPVPMDHLVDTSDWSSNDYWQHLTTPGAYGQGFWQQL